MTRSEPKEAGFLGAAALLVFVGVVSTSGCGIRKGPPAPVGAVNLALKLSGGAQIDIVNYLISGNGVAPIIGSIEVAKFSTISELVTGIPAGKGYTVELDAESTDAKVHCTGRAMFDVVLGKTAQANVVMQCTDSRPVGGVSITGTFDNCPLLTSHTASPTAAPLGGTIMLSAKGSDLDGDALTFEWSESDALGRFEEVKKIDNRTASVGFTCGFSGQTIVAVTVTDGTCGDTGEIAVICGNFTGVDGGVDRGPDGLGSGTGGRQGSGSGGATGSSGGASGGAASGGNVGSSGGMTGSSGGAVASGGSGAGTGGAGTAGAGTSTGGAGGAGGAATGGGGGGAGAPVCPPTSVTSAECQACTTGPDCATETAGDCATFADAADRKLCQDVYSCFVSNSCNCLSQGDPLKCWCGTNNTTCLTADSGPTAANGVCLSYVFAAAKSMVAADIKTRFSDGASPLGRAVLLIQCQDNWCNTACGLP